MERAARWYGKRNAHKRVEFLDAVEVSLNAIRQNPLMFVRVGRVRRALIRGFSYMLVFQVSDERIVVTDCVHQHQNPRRWRRG
jgi:plasmid stabilization system protein ParE